MADFMPSARKWMGNVSDYWAKDNAQYSQENPGMGNALLRAFNPVTAYGSALGATSEAAKRQDIAGAVLSGLSGVPVMGKLGAMKAAGAIPFLGAGNKLTHQVPLFDRLAKDQVRNLMMGEVADGHNQQPIDDRVIQNLALFNSNPTQQPAIQLFPTYDSRPVSSAKSK